MQYKIADILDYEIQISPDSIDQELVEINVGSKGTKIKIFYTVCN